jgi:hypothetical protein
MSFSLSGQVRLVPVVTDTLATTTLTDTVTIQQALSLSNGTGPAQADGYWRDVRTVTGTGTDVVNLGSLPVNVFGGSSTLSLGSLRLIYLRNRDATGTLLYSIGGGAAKTALPPGGVFLWSAPTAGPTGPWLDGPTGISVQNLATGPVPYEVVIAGVKT